MENEKLAAAKALFEAWWIRAKDSQAAGMGMFGLEGDGKYENRDTRAAFCAFVAGMDAIHPAEQGSAWNIDADELDALLYPPRALLKREDWDANTRKPKVAAPLAPSDTQGAGSGYSRSAQSECARILLAAHSDTNGAEGLRILSWRERIIDGAFVSGGELQIVTPTGASAAIAARDAEIADLRAALAKQAPDAVRDASGLISATEILISHCEREYPGAHMTPALLEARSAVARAKLAEHNKGE